MLRALWTEDLVSHDGSFHDVPEVGINPQPVQQPIPITMGGGADPVLRRIARMADGWILPGDGLDELAAKLDDLEAYLSAEGRALEDLVLLGRLYPEGDDPAAWVDRVGEWRDLGVTHLAISVRGGESPLVRLERVADAIESSRFELAD